MKQTSIEWLIDQLEKHYVHYDLKNTIVYEQAKEMHKQEIINSHIDGQPIYSCQSEKAEQYYQETFKKD